MASTAALNLIVNLDDRASSGLRGLAEQSSGLGRTLATLAGGAALGGVLAIGGGLAAAAGSGLSFNSSMENVTAQLNAFTKDGAKSAEILAMIKQRASQTPFAFEEMAKATASLLPASKQSGEGLEGLVKQAEILAALNPAEGLEGAAFALKEALSGDFLSIVERFNLPKQRLNELKAQGVPAMKAVQIAMQEMGADSTLVTNLAATMSGRWSTFKDTLQGLAATASKPLFDILSNSLAGLQTWLDGNQAGLTAFATTLGSGIGAAITFLTGTAIPALIAGWQAISPAVQSAIGVVRSLWSAVQVLFTGDFQGGIFGLDEDAPFINALFTARETIQSLWSAVQVLLTGDFQGGIFGLDEDAPFINALFTARETVQSLWNTVTEFVTGAIPPLLNGFQVVAGLVSNNLMPVMAAIGAMIAAVVIPAFVVWAASATAAAIATVAALAPVVVPILAIGAAVGLLVAAWQRDWGGIRDVVGTAWDGYLLPAFTALRGWLADTLTAALSVLAGYWTTTLKPALLTVWSFISGSVIPLLLDLGGRVFGALGTALSVLAAFWTGTLQPAIRGVWEFLSTTVIPLLAALGDVYLAVLGLAVRTLAGIWTDTLKPALVGVWDYLTTNVKPVLVEVGGTVIDGVKSGLSALADVWTKRLRPALSAMTDFFNNTIRPAIESVRDAIGKVIDFLTTLADKIRNLPGLPSLPGMSSRSLDAGGLMSAPAGSRARLLSDGDAYTYYIDARGAQAGVEQQIERVVRRMFDQAGRSADLRRRSGR